MQQIHAQLFATSAVGWMTDWLPIIAAYERPTALCYDTRLNLRIFKFKFF